MVSKFTHIIVTRVNVLRDDWTQDWLNDRLIIFKRFCYPTIYSQSNQNFKWIVFFSHRTPTSFQNEINKLKEGFPNFIPVFVTDYYYEYMEVIKRYINKDSQFIITSRVDADDGYALDYIDEIQKVFYEVEPPVVINFNNGFIYNLEENKLFIRNHYTNAFCTLIERVEGFKSIWVTDHRELGQLFEIKKNILKKPMWIQLVHGNNICNVVRNDAYRVPLKKISNRIKGVGFNFGTDSSLMELFISILTSFPLYTITICIRPFKRYIEDNIRVLKGKRRKFK
jgi:hypothetical protein